ncbi:Oxoglutarate/iron-dependent dioxygenase [Corchorus capsularis]|uniref:procollagen-proline 3-dioxygenase n=1 Tax=Corchorus capsularis TaxID=210143 RepID=A0A1R3GRT7_COCAP|nr:Oxoglutarate/iron-dependent dioxygenase [Corchorus capsularis]
MEHPRLILHNFLTEEECKELEFIHKSCSTVGYRPNVFSTTLSHLIATNSAHLIIPFLPIRDRLKEKVEEVFGCEYELVTEFTGLISWCKGASIGWHSDDNRSYLKQRDFTAVCYLNTYQKDFEGGLFHFQDGEPKTIAPLAGDAVMYTADSRNTHSVDEVTDGERLTLALWFSRDSSHDEDAKLIPLLSESLLHKSNNMLCSFLPLPASDNMYWYSPNQDSHHDFGFDIRLGRLHALGFDVYYSQGTRTSDLSELQMEPMQLARGDYFLDHKFVNILHALQVVQFYFWKVCNSGTIQSGEVVQISQAQLEKIIEVKSVFMKDPKLAKTIFRSLEQHSFGSATFSAAITAWDDYSCWPLDSWLLRSSQDNWKSGTK